MPFEQVLGALMFIARMWPTRLHLCEARGRTSGGDPSGWVLCWARDDQRLLLALLAHDRRRGDHVMFAFQSERRCADGVPCTPLDEPDARALCTHAGIPWGDRFLPLSSPANVQQVMSALARTADWALRHDCGRTHCGHAEP